MPLKASCTFICVTARSSFVVSFCQTMAEGSRLRPLSRIHDDASGRFLPADIEAAATSGNRAT